MSGFVEARNIEVVHAGGVKNDRVSASIDKGSDTTSQNGYGNVPFNREEYVAESIVAYFNVDLAQLRGYGFDAAVTELLYALALWKVRAFLEDGLRLRTACDLDAAEVTVSRPLGVSIPTRAVLEAALPGLIGKAKGSLGDAPRRVVTYKKGN
jgi:CRISPR-associated protein Csb1